MPDIALLSAPLNRSRALTLPAELRIVAHGQDRRAAGYFQNAGGILSPRRSYEDDPIRTRIVLFAAAPYDEGVTGDLISQSGAEHGNEIVLFPDPHRYLCSRRAQRSGGPVDELGEVVEHRAFHFVLGGHPGERRSEPAQEQAAATGFRAARRAPARARRQLAWKLEVLRCKVP